MPKNESSFFFWKSTKYLRNFIDPSLSFAPQWQPKTASATISFRTLSTCAAVAVCWPSAGLCAPERLACLPRTVLVAALQGSSACRRELCALFSLPRSLTYLRLEIFCRGRISLGFLFVLSKEKKKNQIKTERTQFKVGCTEGRIFYCELFLLFYSEYTAKVNQCSGVVQIKRETHFCVICGSHRKVNDSGRRKTPEKFSTRRERSCALNSN